MAPALGFIGGPQERRKEQADHGCAGEKKMQAPRGRQHSWGHAPAARGRGYVFSLTSTRFLTYELGTAGVTSPSGTEQP